MSSTSNNQPTRVLLAVLCTGERDGWINPELALRLVEATHSTKYFVTFQLIINKRPVDLARNTAAEIAMQQGVDWLVMIDNDQVPPVWFIDKILDQVNVLRDDISMITLPTHMATLHPADTVHRLNLNVGVWSGPAHCRPLKEKELRPGWQQVPCGGMGVFFVRRRVLEAVEKPWFRLAPASIAENVPMGEDVDFIRLAQKAGFNLWTNKDFRAEHIHSVQLRDIHELIEREVAERLEQERKRPKQGNPRAQEFSFISGR